MRVLFAAGALIEPLLTLAGEPRKRVLVCREC